MATSSLLDAARAERDAEGYIRRHREILRRFENLAETAWSQGKIDHAVDAAAQGARLAGLGHPGVLASPRLEEVLTGISRGLPPLPARRTPAKPERVLVVVSATYAVGGHTRVLWRWIARDPSRVYTVVTTSQHGVMPDGVHDAVRRSGGEIIDLSIDMPALERAMALRALAADTDTIVLLDHPSDPLPTVAFAGLADRPPIVKFNHGDQWFWLGRPVTDVLMNIRSAGEMLAARRGLPPARLLTTPFAVSGPDGHGGVMGADVTTEGRSMARAAVLEQLGAPADAVLLVTVGAPFKYEGPEGLRLPDLVEPVLAAAPHVYLVAAGPEDAGQWRELRQRTGGRVVALGQLSDGIGALHAAADIYLESLPTGGTSASAEAAAHGLPVISAAATAVERDLQATDAIYGTTCPIGHDAYRELLARLIAEPALRAELGDAARQAIAAADPGWEPAVERAYELARRLGPIREDELAPVAEADDVDIIVDFSIGSRRQPLDYHEHLASLYELIARSPAVSQLFCTPDPATLCQVREYPSAFAAPPPEAEALRAIVAEFRLLRDQRVAQRFLIALEPETASEALPILEAALSEGSDVDIDVMIEPEPARLRPAGSLEVVLADDGSTDPDRHVCALPAAAVASALAARD